MLFGIWGGGPELRVAECAEVMISVPEADDRTERPVFHLIFVSVFPFVCQGGIECLPGFVNSFVLKVIVVYRYVKYGAVERVIVLSR